MNFLVMKEDQYASIMERLDRLEKAFQKKSPDERYYSIKQLMQLLGVSRKTVQAWRDKRLIAFSQVGRNIWFSRSAIDAFMLRNHYRSRFQTKI